ncbi:hypothetical protein [[Mycoplasma] gypis]|uniref:Uncharacterized protein n=1 Tax=[Mycoplasma] gypis TaxID=92404 RepID=A0ABZ2RNJ4_9BACT|nr:hypothetical protein [[Mycoplasma] gypis]MBN0919389.1 hypothetical protein [[Mycoplasma] gypis]
MNNFLLINYEDNSALIDNLRSGAKQLNTILWGVIGIFILFFGIWWGIKLFLSYKDWADAKKKNDPEDTKSKLKHLLLIAIVPAIIILIAIMIPLAQGVINGVWNSPQQG